ncbi:hypothetical protein [uncultured Maritimibacter sp.]|uniref:hypothetical protein n=1 Tax=uncultured Maritimibacter sp. TaxID=991866 RepID=UPI00259A04A8|nr:hypothetical protein [uncultured Maritimibacter sp.]
MTYVTNLSEKTAPARKDHVCVECGRTIPKGECYLRQANTDGSQVWTYKAHVDCAEFSVAYRTSNKLWDDYDWMPLWELIDFEDDLSVWRGRYPHAVCRLELRWQKYAA